MSLGNPSAESLRVWTARRRKRWERFSDDELRKKRGDIEVRRDSLKHDFADGRFGKQSETFGEMRWLETQSEEIAIELFVRRADKPAPPGIVDVKCTRLRLTELPVNPGKSTGVSGGNREAFLGKRRRPERSNPEVAKRAALVRSNPNTPAQEMCEIFDRNNVPLHAKWLDAGFKTWSKAYKDSKYLSRIQTLISKDRQRT